MARLAAVLREENARLRAEGAGVISITLGLLLLLVLWNRWRGRKRERAVATGAKSRALRDALVRRMRDRAMPVPA